MWHVRATKRSCSPQKHILSDLKIRASYGVNGNQPGSAWLYGISIFGTKLYGRFGFLWIFYLQPQPGMGKNYNRTWDWTSFINRIFLSVEYYNPRYEGFAVQPSISATTPWICWTAWGNVWTAGTNRGVELEPRTHQLRQWQPLTGPRSQRLSHNKNKIVSLNGQLEQSIEGTWDHPLQ